MNKFLLAAVEDWKQIHSTTGLAEMPFEIGAQIAAQLLLAARLDQVRDQLNWGIQTHLHDR